MRHAVIMAGGTGTRFWPMSREARPKQLLSIIGRKSLLRLTFDRLSAVVGEDRIWIVTSDSLVRQCVDELPELNPDNVLSEPMRRNTAPCIGLAAMAIKRRDADGVMGVFPADHLIAKPERFTGAATAAYQAAEQDSVIVTLGVQPFEPATGYGYIDFGEKLSEINGSSVHMVNGFIEKPDQDRARRLLEMGNYYWNAGIFFFSVATILDSMGRHMPDLMGALEKIACAEDFKSAAHAAYPGLEANSIDHGVMEHADNLRGIPVDIGWSDVGAWTALDDLLEPDESGNVAVGRLLAMDADRYIVHASNRLVALVGVDDLIVVPTDDAVLVCHKSRAQDIKKIYEELMRRGWKEYL